LRRTRWLLALLLLAFCALASSVSLLLPLNEAPDEEAHFDLIRFVAEQGRIPLTNQERLALGDKGDASPIYHSLVALLSQHVDVAEQAQRHYISPDKRYIPYDGPPPGRALHTEDERPPFRGVVLAWHLARLVSVPLAALTILMAYLIAGRLYPGQGWLALSVAGVAAFVPRFVINSAVISDDNLVIPLIALALYFAVRILQGDTRRRLLIALGASMGLAAITKYHSLVLVPEISLVFLLAALRQPGSGRVWLGRWARVMAVFLLCSAWWFAFLILRFNRVAELGLLGGLLAPLGDPTTTELSSLNAAALSFSWDWVAPVFRTFWVVAGSSPVYAPDVVYTALAGLTGIAGLGLLVRVLGRLRQRLPWRPESILLAVHALLYLGIILGRYQVFVARGISPPAHSTQGRHLYPALVAIALFYVLGWQEVLAAGRRWLSGISRPAGKRESQPARQGSGWWAAVAILSMFGLSLGSFLAWVLPVYQPFLPVSRRAPEEIAMAERLEATFSEGLTLVGYTPGKPGAMGNLLPVELFWQAGGEHERDYLVRLCLQDQAGQPVVCQWGHPADGLYPTRAWEAGDLVRDRRALPLPPCLGAGEYQLTLSVWPLRTDTAAAVIDDARATDEVLPLGRLGLPAAAQAPPGEAYVCTVDSCLAEGQLRLTRLRQALTGVVFRPAGAGSASSRLPELALRPTGGPDAPTWAPLQTGLRYLCPDGSAFFTQPYIVAPALTPGEYVAELDGHSYAAWSVVVSTRPRNFNAPPEPATRKRVAFAGQLQLLGYQVDLSPRPATEPIEVTTYWQARQYMPHNYNLAVHVLDGTRTSRRLADQPLGDSYPTTLWAPGEYVQDQQVLKGSAADLAPGLYTLELRVYAYVLGSYQSLPATDLDAQQALEGALRLGQIRISDPAEAQPPSHRLVVRLGQHIQLLGYDLPRTSVRAGESLALALHWQALSTPPSDYTVFTQLIGPDGRVWGQQDNPPQGGRYPTSAWSAGDKVVDRYLIPVRPDAPAGLYHLWVGMYTLSTGARLPALDEQGQRLADDAIVLAEVRVEPAASFTSSADRR